MTASARLVSLLVEHLAPLGTVTARRMFGGAGIYCDGLMIGLVVHDTLYLRTDDECRPLFEAEGLVPFRYETRQRQVTVASYYSAPIRLLDEPDEMVEWGRRALAAQRKASAQQPARRRGRTAS